MRLWHIDLIPYLPKSQLLAQWRELNSIFKKQDKHILINYVYGYPKKYLMNYACKTIDELYAKNCKVSEWNHFNNYFKHVFRLSGDEQFKEHDNEYLTICYWNLREKYIRGQKDFTEEVWNRLDQFYKNKFGFPIIK